MKFTVEEIAEITGGDLVNADNGVTCEGAAVDSRLVTPGQLFVALQGERVDGHDFVAPAISAGATAALVERPIEAPIPSIVVPSAVAALGSLAAAARKRWANATVIALTGSSGKTTTKDLLAHVLRSQGTTVAPQGSYNTEVGVPLTILSAPADVRFVVLEMGMRGLGHIRYLAELADPDIAMVLNVGTAHAGMLEGVGTIAEAKGEIVEGLRSDAVAVLNADDPQVRAMDVRTRAAVRTFGESAGADIRALDIRVDENARVQFSLVVEGSVVGNVAMQLIGEHQISNALGAATCAIAAGIAPADVARELSTAKAESAWRMEMHDLASGVRVISDCYNANPESMRAALKSLRAMGRPAWAVLGEMRELGTAALSAHDEIGRLVVRLDIPHLICVGEGTKVMHLAASNEGSWADESAWVATQDEAFALLSEHVRPGDVILVKGSRSVGLEQLVDQLLKDPWRSET